MEGGGGGRACMNLGYFMVNVLVRFFALQPSRKSPPYGARGTWNVSYDIRELFFPQERPESFFCT